ncbi:hypothetical protein OG897_24920 [Streptomyces sp. NBC_00237]|uniref:hypothetical protein n=1 Tax=Streptomyces sp. NBC_00237 TaxID=2975687 RepID=UPI002252EA16|nr:hypothetical protein [Streptomyces sp. NBC_00237]MCX5204684.1 hypothetical protein [Streptomyces sp. NBC_00237]
MAAAGRRRRLRSSTVVLGGMGVLALTLTSCGDEPDRRCVDPVTQEELPSYECDDDDDGGGSSGSSATHHGAYYYGGSVSNRRVSGGSFDKQAVDRGGFGCSGSGGG